MNDVVVISDIHLGSENCQAKQLTHFLARIRKGELPTERLVLNGDVFDSIDFRRLKKHHWRILSELRKLADHIEVVWINGNHDGPAEHLSPLLGVRCVDEYTVESGGRRILFLHGHTFDEFISRYPLITRTADRIYQFLQSIDKSHTFAKFAKNRSKTFLRCAQKVEADAVRYAQKRGCDAVCCGHTHLPVANSTGPVQYFNSGCWTENPCHYLTVQVGAVSVCAYAETLPLDVSLCGDQPALAPLPGAA
ncbi:MAG: UDP-2,3-diacylglucosamine diphosphatase [Gemmata sp.]